MHKRECKKKRRSSTKGNSIILHSTELGLGSGPPLCSPYRSAHASGWVRFLAQTGACRQPPVCEGFGEAGFFFCGGSLRLLFSTTVSQSGSVWQRRRCDGGEGGSTRKQAQKLSCSEKPKDREAGRVTVQLLFFLFFFFKLVYCATPRNTSGELCFCRIQYVEASKLA